jgi:hypothetical protein
MRSPLYILIYAVLGFTVFFCVFSGIFLMLYWCGMGKRNIAFEVGLIAGMGFSLGSLLFFLAEKR